MIQKDAQYLLFAHDFGKGPLFRNQVELACDIIEAKGSDYYVDKNDTEEYSKVVNRLKAYISQLLSESATRKISKEFNRSLKILLSNKLKGLDVNANDIADTIISDLQNRNQRFVYLQPQSSTSISNRNPSVVGDFIKGVLDAEYISVFTSREIKFEYEVSNKKISFIDLLLDDLFISFKNRLPLKYYRFNFPLEQTSQLFWRGLRKELSKHLLADKKNLSSVLAVLKLNDITDLSLDKRYDGKYKNFEEKVASEVLSFLSINEIVNVFHLKAPIYLVPSVALSPNKLGKASTYLFLQSESDIENIHKLSSEELLLWRFFVWDNLKKNKSGELITYSILF
jgi:hypothetical protein